MEDEKMSIEKFNKNAVVFRHQPKPGAPYFKLEELYKNNGPDKIYPLLGLYINKTSKYGPQPVIFTAAWYANAPSHMVEQCEGILQDPETIDQINAGLCGWQIYTYEDSNKQVRYSVRFKDLQKAKNEKPQKEDLADSSLDISSDNLPY
jgi:hypothetical protein